MNQYLPDVYFDHLAAIWPLRFDLVVHPEYDLLYLGSNRIVNSEALQTGITEERKLISLARGKNLCNELLCKQHVICQPIIAEAPERKQLPGKAKEHIAGFW